MCFSCTEKALFCIVSGDDNSVTMFLPIQCLFKCGSNHVQAAKKECHQHLYI